jgi:hypothetical protein
VISKYWLSCYAGLESKKRPLPLYDTVIFWWICMLLQAILMSTFVPLINYTMLLCSHNSVAK